MLHEGMKFEEYLALPAVQRTTLHKVLTHTPARAKWERDNPKPDTEAQRFGGLLHTLLMEPEKIGRLGSGNRSDAEYVVSPYPDRRGNRWKELVAQHEGQAIVMAKELDQAEMMANAIGQTERGGVFLLPGKREATIVVTDDETGLKVKVRPDFWIPSRRLVVDIKSTKSVLERDLRTAMWRYGYYFQAGMYTEVMEQAGFPVDHFLFLFIEKEPPHDVVWRRLSDDYLELAYRHYRRTLRVWAECLESGEYPGLPDAVQTIDMPRWAEEEFDEGFDLD